MAGMQRNKSSERIIGKKVMNFPTLVNICYHSRINCSNILKECFNSTSSPSSIINSLRISFYKRICL